MSEPLIARYAQFLAQHPDSEAFVELAKLHLEAGDAASAIAACQAGLEHHPDSALGHVLWGKALVLSGKASEAMAQFDLATKLNREDARAYRWVAEVLLRRKLYRTAVPVLRKGAALEPADSFVHDWLAQAQAALAGGAAPVLGDHGAPELLPPTVEPSEPAESSTTQALDSDEAQPTRLMTAVAASDPEATGENTAPTQVPGDFEAMPTMLLNTQALAAASSSGPSKSGPTDSQETIRGLTSTFDALKAEGAAAAVPSPDDPFAAFGPPSAPDVVPVMKIPGPQRPAGEPRTVPDANVPVPAAAAPAPAAPAPAAPKAPPKPTLLADVPDMHESGAFDAPKTSMVKVSAEVAARAYEEELRKKFEAEEEKPTFWKRFGGIVIFIAVILVVGGALGGSYLMTRQKHHGLDLPTALAKAKTAINEDTPQSLKDAVDLLSTALEMDSGSTEAAALKGYAHALRFHHYTHADDDRVAATAAFGRSGVKDLFPALVAVGTLWLAPDAAAEEAAAAPLLGANPSSALQKTEAHAAAGEYLVFRKRQPDEGLKRLQMALDQQKDNVRALVSVGRYYLDANDNDAAAESFETAAKISPNHPEVVLGLASAKMAGDRPALEMLSEVEKLPTLGLSVELNAERAMVLARLKAFAGQAADGEQLLTGLAVGSDAQQLRLLQSRSDVFRIGGRMGAALAAIDEASKFAAEKKLTADDDAIVDQMGRILLARGQEKELLGRSRFSPDSKSKVVALMRGLAYLQLEEFKKARTELEKTRVKDKYPVESAVAVAMADFGEDQKDRARDVLDALHKKTKKNKALTALALGKVLLARGEKEPAIAALTEAAAAPRDYEANAMLGELSAAAGKVDEAKERFKKSIERNQSFARARSAYIRLLLSQSAFTEAVDQVKAWQADGGKGPEFAREAAVAWLWSGEPAQALTVLKDVVKPDLNDAPLHRIYAQVLFANGNARDGLKELERSNKLDASDAETFCEIGNNFVRQGNPDYAGQAYEAARAKNPNAACGIIGPHHARPGWAPGGANKDLPVLGKSAPQSWDRAMALGALARTKLAEKAIGDARKFADQAVRECPSSSAAQFALGEVASKQNDLTLARTSWERAAFADPTWALVRLRLGELLSRNNDTLKNGIENYESFLVLSQDEGEIGRVKKALPALKKRLTP